MKQRLTLCHPFVAALFLAGAAACAMAIRTPIGVAISIAFAAAYHISICGVKRFWRTMRFSLIICAGVMLINPLFNHKGLTVLFYLFKNPITLEATVYGVCSAFMLLSVLLWFGCINEVLTTERILTLFSKRLNSLGLYLSMSLRLVPSLIRNGKALYEASGDGEKGLKKAASVAGTLMAVSMEDSIITAESMRARGFGKSRRTCYNNDVLKGTDKAVLVLTALLLTASLAAVIMMGGSAVFYPRLELAMDAKTAICAGVYILYLIFPFMAVR